MRQRHKPCDIFAGRYAARCDDRDAFPPGVTPGYLDHLRNQVFQRVVFVLDLFVFETQVSSRFRPSTTIASGRYP